MCMKRRITTAILTFITSMAFAAGMPGTSGVVFGYMAEAAEGTNTKETEAAEGINTKETEAAIQADAVNETETIEETETEASAFHYEHDPRLNPKAMVDAVVNPDAVYGFSPNPYSESLAAYLDYDWSDPKVVEEGRKDRLAYHESIRGMYLMLEKMKKEEASVEEIARALSDERNNIRYQANADDPEKLAALKESNLEKYGNEMGPKAEDLYEKYGSWEAVIEKAFSMNSGMDACLGLYDDYYDVYVAAGQIPDRRMYTVQPGDSLMKIAEEMNGDKETWKQIYALNKDAIPDPSEIIAGQVLILP